MLISVSVLVAAIGVVMIGPVSVVSQCTFVTDGGSWSAAGSWSGCTPVPPTGSSGAVTISEGLTVGYNVASSAATPLQFVGPSWATVNIAAACTFGHATVSTQLALANPPFSLIVSGANPSTSILNFGE